MSTNFNSSLDNLKKQSLISILDNVNIKFPYLKDEINNYINNSSGSVFSTLLGLFSFDQDKLSSSQINASLMMAYLDFYALYTIIYANSFIFTNMRAASESKYHYIESIYNNLFSVIESKKLDKDFKYNFYSSFCDSNLLNIQDSYYSGRIKIQKNILNFDKVLSLPIKKTKAYNPSSIYCTDDDRALHDIESKITNKNSISYNIIRRQNNKIGICSSSYKTNQSVRYNIPSPDIKGTIFGSYYTKIYTKIDNLEYKYNGEDLIIPLEINKIFISSSSNNVEWVKSEAGLPGEYIDISLDEDIKSGLSIRYFDGENLSVGDFFILDIKNITLSNPNIDINANFRLLDKVSYIQYKEISPFALSNIEHKIQSSRDSTENHIDPYNNSLITILPIFNNLDRLKIKATQSDFNICSINGSTGNMFSFKLDNIQAILNEYEPNGALTTEKIAVEKINNIQIDTTTFLQTSNTVAPKLYTEFSIVADYGNKRLEIPILERYSSDLIFEYIIPVLSGSNGLYKTRFKRNTGYVAKVYDISTSEEITDVDLDGDNLTIPNYNNRIPYAIKYKIELLTMEDMANLAKANPSWVNSSGLYYAYYKDIDGNINLSIKEDVGNSTLSLFTGSLSSTIEMRSFDLPFKSPLIFNYKMICN